jgi:hypothetical protein
MRSKIAKERRFQSSPKNDPRRVSEASLLLFP